jgi:hypothetical protein
MRATSGLITVPGAAAEGVDRGVLSRATAAGELVHLRQRVYLPAGLSPDWELELAADLAACHAPAFAARTAALHLHDVEVRVLPVERELVVVGSARPTVASEVLVHRTVALPEVDRTVVRDIDSTTVERALIDLAWRLSQVQRLRVLDDAIMAGRVDRALMHARADALRRGRKGVRTYLDATAPGAEAAFRSKLEAMGAPLLREAGITDPAFNVVPRHAPAAGLTDVVSEADRVIVDWDGLRFHTSPRARQRDNDKSNAAVLGGYTAIRFTWHDVVVRPAYVIATARRARKARSGRG